MGLWVRFKYVLCIDCEILWWIKWCIIIVRRGFMLMSFLSMFIK